MIALNGGGVKTVTIAKLALGLAWIAALWAASITGARAADQPGPSLALFKAPYYACVRNYYVSPTGRDSNAGTSRSKPWLTLQHANDTGRSAGDCVNVAPGTYAAGVVISGGGARASRTGYVTWRCMVMDKCVVTDVSAGGQNGSFVWDNATQPMAGNYVIIDGFVMRAAAETLYGQGIQLWDGSDYLPNSPNSVHHVWLLNSIISGYGQSGVQMNDGEYFFVVHNTIYNNAFVGCSAQGSGVSLVTLKAFPGYVRTPDDANNPILGAIGSFNNAVAWNVLYNNATTQCGGYQGAPAYDTDGNNIIIDTLDNGNDSLGGAVTGPVYPGATLIAFNITYNAGGRGIHIFRSENVTVANNSCYNSDLDPYDNGSYRPCIGDLDSVNNVFLNNIAYAIAPSGAGNGACQWPTGVSITCLAWNGAYTGGLLTGGAADSFSHNISFCIGQQPYGGCNAMFNGDSFSCAANQCGTNPGWVGVGNRSQGTETTPPVGANFALRRGSPAIGAGLTASYLPAQSVDIGACASTLIRCPGAGSQP
jgi:hypothetical protein